MPHFQPGACAKILTRVQKPYPKWAVFLFGPLLSVIGFFYRSYTANRARLAEFRSNPKVAFVLKALALLVLFGWLLVWLFAPDGNRGRLTEEFRQAIEGVDSAFDR